MVSRSKLAGMPAGESQMNETEARAAARELIDQLADPARRDAALAALDDLGPAALPAVREGLGHGHWQVRRWCALYLDRHPDVVSLELLIPLLRDPKSKVRLFAVHSLSCEHCKGGENPIDVVPLLLERIDGDDSIRVRRMAVAMLAYGRPDRRAVAVFKALLERETDAKLRLHASLGLMRCLEVGIAGAE
jgi:HEAT repeat protein